MPDKIDSYLCGSAIIRKGQQLELTDAGAERFGLPVGLLMKVVGVSKSGDRVYTYLLTNNDEYYENLGDPDNFYGRPGHCMKISDKRLMIYFSQIYTVETSYVVGKVKFKGHNLKGMKCRVLANMEGTSSEAFVEFEKDIGGGSCDGIGKTGHCAIVPMYALGSKPKTEKKGG